MDKLFSDEQLIAFFVLGNKEAWQLFFETYRIHSITISSEAEKMYRGSGISFDDFYSVALECIQVALNKYQLYSCTFYSYWKSITLKAFAAYVKRNSLNSVSNNGYIGISLDDLAYSDSKTKYEEILGVNDPSLDKGITNKELFTYIYQKLELLDEKERQFLFLLIDEYDPKSIQVLMNLKGKEFYHLRSKIQKKLNLELIKDYFN